jgi:hypothetical protein
MAADRVAGGRGETDQTLVVEAAGDSLARRHGGDRQVAVGIEHDCLELKKKLGLGHYKG